MTDYFGYDVHFVMNITDIDDKVRLITANESLNLTSHARSYYALDIIS
jgi:cysteinyl-tRNA synthetase